MRQIVAFVEHNLQASDQRIEDRVAELVSKNYTCQQPSRALDRGPFCFREDSFTHTPHGACASAILSTDVLRLRLLDGDVRPGAGRRGGCVYDPWILRQARCSIGVAVGLVTAPLATKDSLAEAERFANHPAPSTAPRAGIEPVS